MGLTNTRANNNQRLSVADHSALDFVGTVPMSFSCWVRLPSEFGQVKWAALFAKLDNRYRASVISGNEYGWHWRTPTQFNFTHNNDDDLLHHFAFIKRGGGAGDSEQWRDGVLVGTGNSGSIGGPNGGDLWITNNSQQQNRALQCDLFDFRCYNRDLAAPEVQAIHASRGVDGVLDGLVFRHNYMDEAPGTTIGTTRSTTGEHDGVGGGTSLPEYIENETTLRRRTA